MGNTSVENDSFTSQTCNIILSWSIINGFFTANYLQTTYLYCVVSTVLESVSKVAAIERFVGSDVRILSTEKIFINNTIEAERVAVSLSDDEAAEDRGLLLLYPIGDDKYCLQLCYLQYSDTPDTYPSVYLFRFLPDFFSLFPSEVLNANGPFRFDETTEQQFNVCTIARTKLHQLQAQDNMPPLVRSLMYTETAIHLLQRALECITAPFTSCQVPACRFLAYEGERDKIMTAMQLIEDSLDQPHTIRELSRKVAMNECYLKKGFKALAGKTIHEYQQGLRIGKAKMLLQQQGMSVTDVANTLGYSSISHFSTAFKKVTGMKPCELLA